MLSGLFPWLITVLEIAYFPVAAIVLVQWTAFELYIRGYVEPVLLDFDGKGEER